MKVGFIGLGVMGTGMASNLLKAGHAVTVWNRSEAAVGPLVSLGAKAASTAARAAQGEVLHSMLASDKAVREVFYDGGVLDAMDPGMVHVNHATISLDLARELAQEHAKRGIEYVAAPVFGRPDLAAAGKLNIVVAGKQSAIDRVQPLLDVLGAKTWPMGDTPEHANVVKLGGNFMLATAVESMAEATALTRAHGVSAADFLNILTQTIFAGPVYQGYGKLIIEERFKPAGFPLPMIYKDIGLVQDAAAAKRVPLPFASVLRDTLLEAMGAGDEELDMSALSKVAARRAHLE